MTLPDAIIDVLPPDDGLHISTVTVASPLIVNVRGNPTPMGRLSSYTPTVGDVVAVFRQDSTWLCLGKIV
jgi:hypothetical protein